MIFVTLGNQNFPFRRLLIAVDQLIEKGIIHEEVVVQNGHTPYQSSRFTSCTFLSKKDFDHHIEQSRFVISHAGAGSIINCLKKGKKVIVAARLAEYDEHIDNHQTEIVTAFAQKRLIIPLEKDMKDIEAKVKTIDHTVLETFISNNALFNKRLLEIINNF